MIKRQRWKGAAASYVMSYEASSLFHTAPLILLISTNCVLSHRTTPSMFVTLLRIMYTIVFRSFSAVLIVCLYR